MLKLIARCEGWWMAGWWSIPDRRLRKRQCMFTRAWTLTSKWCFSSSKVSLTKCSSCYQWCRTQNVKQWKTWFRKAEWGQEIQEYLYFTGPICGQNTSAALDFMLLQASKLLLCASQPEELGFVGFLWSTQGQFPSAEGSLVCWQGRWAPGTRTEHTAALSCKMPAQECQHWDLAGTTRARRQHHTHHLKPPNDKSTRFPDCFLTLQPSPSAAIGLLFQALSVTMVLRPPGSPHQLCQCPLNNKLLKTLDISVIPAKGMLQFSSVHRAEALTGLRVSWVQTWTTFPMTCSSWGRTVLTLIPLVELPCLWWHRAPSTHVFLTLTRLTPLQGTQNHRNIFSQLHFFTPPDVSLPLFPPTPRDMMMKDSFLELG